MKYPFLPKFETLINMYLADGYIVRVSGRYSKNFTVKQ